MNKKIKNSQEKPHLELIPYSCLIPIAAAFHSGIVRHGYKPNDWKDGIRYSVYFAAAMRHAWDWFCGKRKDKDSGLNPLAHVAACILILLYYELHPEIYRKKKLDDRTLV